MSSNFPPALFTVHPEQLPQRPWITLKERDQMIPTGTEGDLLQLKASASNEEKFDPMYFTKVLLTWGFVGFCCKSP